MNADRLASSRGFLSRIFFYNLAVFIVHKSCVIEEANGSKITDEVLAKKWLQEFDRMAEVVYSDYQEAFWNYSVNLTDHNKQLQIEASLRKSQFLKHAHENASKFDWKNFKDVVVVRQFDKVYDIGLSVLPNKDIKRLDMLLSEMQMIYSTAEICEKRPSDTDEMKETRICVPQNPDLVRIVATSRDWKEQLWAWKGWRDVTGKRMKYSYIETVKLLNKAAKVGGFKDTGDYWRSMYEMSDLPEACEDLWKQVRPLYQQLHSYVRRKLIEYYSHNKHDFPSTHHIPAHLLGNIWAQTWSNIIDIVLPFPKSPVVNMTNILKEKEFSVKRMFREADSFFKSLGLPPMPPEFWNYSMIVKPDDGRQVICHASATDFYNKRDFRIKQCTDVTAEYMLTTHHEMGHVQYYLMYKNLPVVFRRGPNPGFHEAVGDVIALSVSTPEHLFKIGLIDKTTDSHEADINFLMTQALGKVVFLPYSYLVDKWRWGVFDGSITPKNYNRAYWKLRCKLQGISPPIPRSEEDFDPGAKFHVAKNTPYIRYFVSYIIQFQFHKALCVAAGHRGPLHKCDIYNSSAAGEKLKNMLSLGSSKPWPDAMEVLTGQRQMDAGPLLEYFQPLHEWLQKENALDDITWEEDCPAEAFTSKAANEYTSQFSVNMFSFIVSVAIALQLISNN